MADEWVNRIYVTSTGEYVATVSCSESNWTTRMTGQGAGTFTIPVHGAGISQADLEEWTTPNLYTITQEWAPTDHIVFAGVIQDEDWDDASETVTVSAVELRGAYFNNRMLWPLPHYNIYGGDSVVLAVTGKSHAGAVRAVLTAAQFGGVHPAEVFPLDLPADGAGDFSAEWKRNERLFVEDHLTQIEEDGCETYLRPYRTVDGDLRYDVMVQDGKLVYGAHTDFPIRGGSSPVRGLRVKRDGIAQMTGVAVFGEGGKSALMQWGPDPIPSSFPIPLRDIWINRSDLNTDTRLRAVGNQQYAVLQFPSYAWRFDLHVNPGGPEFAGVGRELWMDVPAGHPRLSSGYHQKRVIALRGDMGFFVTPEVDDAD